MFLYTICPSCKTGCDITDLMRGKKLICKGCTRPFNVAAAPRPRDLPPPMPFTQPGPAVHESRVPADAIVSSPLRTAKPSEPPTYINGPPAIKLKRPIEKPFARPMPRQAVSTGGGWWGRGGAGGIIFLIIIGIRICAGISRTTHHPAPVQGQRPPAFQQFEQQPKFIVPIPKDDNADDGNNGNRQPGLPNPRGTRPKGGG